MRLSIFFYKKLKDKYEIVHTHSMSLSLALKIVGIKFVKTIHIAKNNVGIFNSKGDQEIAISDEIYNERVDCFLKDKTKLNLIYNGVSNKFYSLYNESCNSKRIFLNNKIQLLVVASVNYRKGQDILLKALNNLNEVDLDKLEVNFLGEYDDVAQKWLKPYINDNIRKKIKFHGTVKPEPFYLTSNITILPSRLEGFPLTTIEAMLAGNLVIRSDVEGANQQINSETGYLFKNEGHLELSELLEKLINNTELIFEKAKKGREYAYENFTLDRMVDNVEDVYKKIN